MMTTLLVGTTKGVFLISTGKTREDWVLTGPFCDGWPINHAIGDAGTGTLWAAGGGEWQGAGVWRSDDGGKTWTLSKLSNGKFDAWMAENPEMAAQFGVEPAGPAPFTGEIDSIWSLGLTCDRLYAGSRPAQLFASTDGGESWEKVQGLTDHPSSEHWEPGGAGLTLHTIVMDPERPEKLWLGISAAGVFASEDAGRNWDRRNRRSNEGGPENDASGDTPVNEVGHCVHNMVRAAAAGPGQDMLYQQNHEGVFRSSDGGRSWQEITEGLPSGFGFPIAVHPRDPQTIWVLPLNGDTKGRYPPDAAAAIWKSRDGGESWSDKRDGLPGENCFFTVLRQAMATDRGEPAGVYFGTNSGSVFASSDEGETWTEIARHLPTVLCVETLTRG